MTQPWLIKASLTFIIAQLKVSIAFYEGDYNVLVMDLMGPSL